jgi:hypothetical protein
MFKNSVYVLMCMIFLIAGIGAVTHRSKSGENDKQATVMQTPTPKPSPSPSPTIDPSPSPSPSPSPTMLP